MSQKTVFQCDIAGFYAGPTTAEESPLEPGVWLMPARAVETAPPDTWPDNQWPRWNGASWQLVNKPPAKSDPSPVSKLSAFLAANPDVAALISDLGGV